MQRVLDWLRGRLVYLLILAPILLCVFYTYTFAVNVIWDDQWEGMLPLFQKWHEGTLCFADFWAHYYEHRHVVPRLLMFALGLATKWSTWAELAVIQLIVIAMLGTMLAVFRRQCASARQLWLMLPLAFLATSLRQYENFLYGWQIVSMLAAAAAVGSFSCLHLMNQPRRLKLKFAAAIAAATVATYSAASGLLVWPAGVVPLLLLPHGRRKKLALAGIWLAIGAAEWVVYFCGYATPAGNPDPAFSWQFFATMIGAALFTTGDLALVVGHMILLITAIVAVLAIKQGSRSRYSFWLALLAFGLFTQVVTTVGRSPFGAAFAQASHYTTFSLLVVIGVYGILSGLCIERPSHLHSALWGNLFSLAAVGLVFSALDAREEGQLMMEKKQYQAFVFATSQSQPDNALLLMQHAQAADIRRGLEFLQQRGWNLFASDALTSRYALPDASLPTLPVRASGVFNRPQFQEKLGYIVVSGRVVNDAGNDVVGGVFLEIDGVCYPTYYGWERGDVANTLEYKDVGGCGFTRVFSKDQLGTGPHQLTFKVLTKDRSAMYAPSGPVEFMIAR